MMYAEIEDGTLCPTTMTYAVVPSIMRDAAIAVHFYCAYGTAFLVAMHAAAALKHQLFDRDGTLARMIWR